MIGRTVGQYEITEKIGEGGMGEVYQRLIREAKAVAALNQPFICGIHGVGEEEGSTYLAMEYVEGETLQQRLQQGSLPVREVLRLGVEISEALDKAHQKGIIHRDLKPSNIMITTEGHAKVMDFGLAKTVAETGGLEEHIHSLSLTLTDQEMIVGTISYMSPEQIRAEALDARSDIFSFGLLLYEMLTGRHPFRSDSALESAAAIVGNPAPALPETLGEKRRALQTLLESMLAKARDQRPGSMRQIQIELQNQLETAAFGRFSDFIAQPSGRKAVLLGGALILAVVVSAIALWPERPSVPETPGIGIPESFHSNYYTCEINPSWNPVDDSIVYQSDVTGNWDIFVQQQNGHYENLTSDNTNYDVSPTWSPDGQKIAFYSVRPGSRQGGIYTMSADGSGVRRVTSVMRMEAWTLWLSWRRQDRIVYSDAIPGKGWHLLSVNPEDGTRDTLTVDLLGQCEAGELSRSGRYLIGRGRSLEGTAGVFLMDLLNRECSQILDDSVWFQIRWDPRDTHIHYIRFEYDHFDMYSAVIDTVNLHLSGPEIRRSISLKLNAFDFNPTSSKAVIAEASDARKPVALIDEEDAPFSEPTDSQIVYRGSMIIDSPVFHPDGEHYFVSSLTSSQGGGNFIFRGSLLNRDQPLERISDVAVNYNFFIDPSGKWLIVDVLREDEASFYPHIMRSSGDIPRLLNESWPGEFSRIAVRDWSVDGQLLALQAVRRSASPATQRIGWAEIDTSRGMIRNTTILEIAGGEPRLSPDGRFIAYRASDRGVNTVWIVNREGTDPRIVVPREWLIARPEYSLGSMPAAIPVGWSEATGYLYFQSSSSVWRVRINGATGYPAAEIEPWGQLTGANSFYGKMDFYQGKVLAPIQRSLTDLLILDFTRRNR